MRPRWHRSARAAGEEGYVSLWVVVIASAIFTAGGILYDTTDKANTAREATMIANEAARAAAQELSVDVIGGSSGYSLDTAAAADAAREYLATAGAEGTVTVEETRVTITTRVPWEPSMMPIPSDTLTATSTVDAKEVLSQ